MHYRAYISVITGNCCPPRLCGELMHVRRASVFPVPYSQHVLVMHSSHNITLCSASISSILYQG